MEKVGKMFFIYRLRSTRSFWTPRHKYRALLSAGFPRARESVRGGSAATRKKLANKSESKKEEIARKTERWKEIKKKAEKKGRREQEQEREQD